MMRKKIIIIFLSCFFNPVFGQIDQSKLFNNVDFLELDEEIDHVLNKQSYKRNVDLQNEFQKMLYIKQLDEKLNDIKFYATQNKSFENDTHLLDFNEHSDNRTITKRMANADEAALLTHQLIQKNGYPAEIYNIETKDGYVLELHRIPWGKKSPMCRNSKKPVVLCMHDIISSSSDFIINGPEQSLGYILADAGYDVWMGNVRGNRYSRNHKNIVPSNMAFWDFTLHEMGIYDLPAFIDFILEETEQEQMTYIGHSMASTLFYILMSERPEYNDKFKVAFHLSPVVFLSWMMSPLLRFFSVFSNAIGLVFDVLGIGDFTPRLDLFTQFGQLVCKAQDFTQVLCTSVLFILSGYNIRNLNLTRFPVYMGHTPAGSSIKVFVHYGQIIQSGSFKQFDWAIFDNLARYNSLKPPLYKLLNMRTPVYLFYSNNDWFANKHDIDRLKRELMPDIAQLVEIRDPQFSHIDFVFGINAKEEVYDDLMEIMKRY